MNYVIHTMITIERNKTGNMSKNGKAPGHSDVHLVEGKTKDLSKWRKLIEMQMVGRIQCHCGETHGYTRGEGNFFMHLQCSEAIRNDREDMKLETDPCAKWLQQCDEGLMKFRLENV
jgi:hypothetical protein